ncbi:MAG: sulfatase-like hydrolase/transferase [Phycisphaera sp.]|nr:sulfatase-like hydrolase/transferase [Phycisphaera sp.]
MRNLFMWIVALAAMSFLLASSITHAAERPNVVLIMVDDMGWSDLGCYGGEIHTPNIDRLASEGLRFTQFYNTAKCETTRAALMSGLYHPEVGVAKLANCMTVAEVMKRAGYFTMMAGKWHLDKQPTDRGFDRYFGHLSGSTPYFLGNDTFRLNGEKFDVPKEGFYTTTADTDYALKFLDEASTKKQPFFLYIAYNAPHYPLQAPEAEVRKYVGKYMDGWDALRAARYKRQLDMGLIPAKWALSPPHPEAKKWDTLSDDEKKHEDLKMATFAAMVDVVDQNVGRLVKKLEAMGVADDTLLLFLSDNGACPFDRTKHGDLMPWDPQSYWCYHPAWANACNTPFRWFKQNQHEGGISTPLIAHWPKGLTAKPGSLTDQPGHLVDIMATLIDVAGTDYPAEFNGETLKPLRGISLLPILKGQHRDGHDMIFFQFSNNRAVRAGQWKLVSARGGPWELYDMDADRTELHDLSSQQPERVAALSAAWEAWAEETGASKGGKSKKNKNAASSK